MQSPFETPPTRARLRDCFDHQTKMVGRFSSFPPTIVIAPCPLPSSFAPFASNFAVLVINTSIPRSQNLLRTSSPPTVNALHSVFVVSAVSSLPLQAFASVHSLKILKTFKSTKLLKRSDGKPRFRCRVSILKFFACQASRLLMASVCLF